MIIRIITDSRVVSRRICHQSRACHIL